MRNTLTTLVLTAAMLAGCGSTVQNPVTGAPERTVMDEAQEIALGRKEHQAVLQSMPPYADSAVQAYVNALGQKLARQSHRANLQWTFTVLDSPDINAFALPGGFVYVTRGIMAYMESEADLAGVIGHEIAHVTARHGAQRATRQQDAGLGVLAATVLGAVLESQGVSGAGRAASGVSQAVAAGYVASYSRDQELQADQLGAEYLSRNRYDPGNMVDVIGVLGSQEQFAADQARAQGRAVSEGGGWLASHPSSAQRLQAITALARNYQGQGQYADDGRARYLQVISGLRFGESDAQGLTRGRTFYHRDLGLTITAPVRWTLLNQPERLVVLSPTRDAALVVNHVPVQAGVAHGDIIRNLLKPTRGRTEALRINGLPATHFVGERANAQGRLEPVEATIVSGPGDNRFLLLWSARDAAALQRARADMQQARDSFRAMTAADHASARPWLVRIVPFPRGGFAELARQSPLESAEQQLRLINGFYGGGAPQPGQMVKVVVEQP
jgi:predicted Zn-dependent protease